MLVDTLTLLQGSQINNATIASGTTNPTSPDIGELFFRTDLTELQVYDGTSWLAFGPTVSVTSFDGRTGAVTLTSGDVTTALGYTPVNKAGDTITGPLVLSSTLNGQTIGSATSLTGTLSVASTINGQTIGSATSLTGTLAVAGAVTSGTINGQTIGSATSLTGTLSVAGATALASVTSGTINGQTIGSATNLTGTFDVAGNTTLAGTTSLAASNVTGTMTFDGVHTIIGLPNPTSATEAATKSYVDGIAAGLSWKEACQAATTTNLTATFVNNGGVGDTLTNSGTQAAFVVDGYTAAVNDRILVKNQTTQSQNGIYVVTSIGSTTTNWVLTRSTDFDATTPVNQINGATVFVENGTTQANTGWTQIDDVTAIDTSNIAFTQFSGTGSVVSSITGTANQIVASSPDNAVTLSFAPNIVIPAPASGTALTTDITTAGTVGININDTFSGAGTTGHLVVSALNNTNGANIILNGDGTAGTKTIRAQGGNFQIINSGYTNTLVSISDTGQTTISGVASDSQLYLNGPTGYSSEVYVAGNGNATSSGVLIQQDTANTGYIRNQAGTLYVGAGSQNAIGISTAGNVTVNTPSSGTALTVDGTATVNNTLTVNPPANGGINVNGSGVAIVEVNDATQPVFRLTSSGNNADWTFIPGTGAVLRTLQGDPLLFQTNGVTSTEISTTGNVTINAPTSGTALTINGNNSGGNDSVDIYSSAITSTANDLWIGRTASTANSVQLGPCINLADTGAGTHSLIQHSGSQTEFWQYNGSWSQLAFWDTSLDLHLGNGNVYSQNGGTAKLMISDQNDGWLRLNQNGNFSNGVYTPGSIRADGATFIGPSYNLQQNTVATYGSISLNGAKGGYTGLLLNDGGYLPTFMSNGTSFGVYSQGTSSYWSWVDNGATFTIDKPIVGNGSITANDESHFAGGGTFTDPQPNVVRDIKCGQDGIAYTGGMHGDNADLTGSITFDSLYEGLSFSFTSATPTYKTSGTWITGGDDNAGLGAINDLALQTWWGVSISPTISGQTIPQGTACWSVDARAGDMYLTNNSYIGGTMYDNSNTGYYVKASSTSVLNNLNLGGRVSFANNVWNISADGTNRMYFTTNADSYWEAHGGYHHFRNGSNTDVVTIDMSGNIVANGNVTAGSDIALKTEIRSIKDALSKVKELTGVTFRYKDQETRSTGLIAQDVEKVLPEAVGVSSTGFKTLAYGNLVGLLVEAIKEISDRLDSIEERI